MHRKITISEELYNAASLAMIGRQIELQDKLARDSQLYSDDFILKQVAALRDIYHQHSELVHAWHDAIEEEA